MMKKLVWLLTLSTLIGCSSTPKVHSPETDEDRIISRIDDLSSRPDWLKESEPFSFGEEQVTSLGMTEIPGEHRVNAAFRVAENNAKAAIAKAIEQKLEFILQNAEEGTETDSSQLRYIGAESSKLLTSHIRPGKRYWEKVATTTDAGERKTIYKVFATVQMPTNEFKKSVLTAIRKRQNKGVSADFAKKVDEHWDQFNTEKSDQ